ncbi:MAG: hypothetical protein JXA17_08910 [Dehalococcoidales bacterium]|nr:hypothetical protein [Dehalococcoidales bacterium]
MKTYLVESYNPGIKFDTGSLVIALTPQVCYQLDKAGIKYSIIEDYYKEAEFSAQDDEYHKSQLQWIDSLDEFLQNNVEELDKLNLKLGTIYYYYLKSMVLDPLYVRCYSLQKLFQAVKPSSVVFISQAVNEPVPDFTLRNRDKSYYSQVIPLLCKKDNIPMESVLLESVKVAAGPDSLIVKIKRLFTQSGIIIKAYFWTQYICKYLGSRFKKHPEKERLNILLLKLAHIGIGFVVDSLLKGHRLYLLSDKNITTYSFFGTRDYLNLKTEKARTGVTSSSIWENTANLLEGHDLIKWVNEKCQSDVSPIILPKLKYFIAEVCPEILGYYKVFSKFYEKAGIAFVITPDESYPIEFAAIAAASHNKGTKSVNFQHGDGVFAARFWNITELAHFNVSICSNKEIHEYFKHQCSVNLIPTELYVSSQKLLSIEKNKRLRERGKGNIKKGSVIYLPTLLMGDHRRLDGQVYPDTWYYRFQKSLIEYFSTRKEYTFVWKGLPTSDAIYNPVPEFIRDNKYTNIKIATNPFAQYLKSAHRVICDYPSTGFYESVAAGIPTISLYHQALIVRESAIAYFGDLLIRFTDFNEAIKHIDEFLNDDPDKYTMSMDLDETGLLDILEQNDKSD